ncbi:MAG: hypothetical protein WBH40_07000 [Ignavibacteriaceae bacterium]
MVKTIKKKKNLPVKKDGRPKTTVKQRVQKITFDYDKIKKLAEFGFIDTQLADLFGVSVQTVNNWKKESPDFSLALKEGKEISDARVVMSLFERATGYEHKEDKIFYDSKSGKTVTVQTTKQYPPDSTSMIFWLKNRQPNKWREKTEIQHSGSLLDKYKAMTPEEREAEWKRIMKRKK